MRFPLNCTFFRILADIWVKKDLGYLFSPIMLLSQKLGTLYTMYKRTIWLRIVSTVSKTLTLKSLFMSLFYSILFSISNPNFKQLLNFTMNYVSTLGGRGSAISWHYSISFRVKWADKKSWKMYWRNLWKAPKLWLLTCLPTWTVIKYCAGSCTSELQLKVNSRLKVNCRKNLGWLGHQLAGQLKFYPVIHFQYMIRPT